MSKYDMDINYLWGKNISVAGLPNTFNGTARAEIIDNNNNRHVIHVGNISNGKLEIIPPDYNEIKDWLLPRRFYGIDNISVTRSWNEFTSLTILDGKNKYDQAMCMLSGKEIEDKIIFYYSDREVKVTEKGRDDSIIDGKKYTRIWDIECEFKAGWNLMWERMTVPSYCETRQKKTNLERIPQNIRWECLNHKS
jgi:hypothetical protein